MSVVKFIENSVEYERNNSQCHYSLHKKKKKKKEQAGIIDFRESLYRGNTYAVCVSTFKVNLKREKNIELLFALSGNSPFEIITTNLKIHPISWSRVTAAAKFYERIEHNVYQFSVFFPKNTSFETGPRCLRRIKLFFISVTHPHTRTRANAIVRFENL